MDFKFDLIKKTNYLKFGIIVLSIAYPLAFLFRILNELSKKEFETIILIGFTFLWFIAVLPQIITSLKYKKIGDLILNDDSIKINENFYKISAADKIEFILGGYEDNNNKTPGTDNYIILYVAGNQIKYRFFMLMEYHLFVVRDIAKKWQIKYPETEIIIT